jgi:hypothetical protein
VELAPRSRPEDDQALRLFSVVLGFLVVVGAAACGGKQPVAEEEELSVGYNLYLPYELQPRPPGFAEGMKRWDKAMGAFGAKGYLRAAHHFLEAAELFRQGGEDAEPNRVLSYRNAGISFQMARAKEEGIMTFRRISLGENEHVQREIAEILHDLEEP